LLIPRFVLGAVLFFKIPRSPMGGLLLVGHVILGVILFWIWAIFLRVSLWFNTFITDFSKVYYPEAIYRLPHSPGL
jgi:hypothetical protein